MASLEAVSVALFLVLLGACFMLRLTRNGFQTPMDTTAQQVPGIPYWVPWIGHSFSLLANPNRLIRKTSQYSGHDIFALVILGSRWNVIASECIAKSILNHAERFVDPTPVLESLLCRAFGADSKLLRRHRVTCRDIGAISGINALGHRKGSLLPPFTRNIEADVPNLISFTESLVDQHPWERLSHITTLDAKIVEADLFSLIRNFVKHITYSSLLGRDFLDIYPGIFEDLPDFDAGFRYLLVGLPRLFPIQAFLGARVARRRMENAINSFHTALDRDTVGEGLDPPWRDLSDVCGVMKDRSSIYRKEGIPPSVKNPLDLHFIWSMGTTISGLVFWLLIRLYDEPTLQDRVRAESAPFARATQPSGSFSIPEPPRLKLDVDGIIKSCKLLRACYWESVRLDTSIVLLRKVQKDFTVREARMRANNDERSKSYTLKAGEYIAIPLALLFSNAAYLESPDLFRPDRFLTPGEDLDSLLSLCGDKSAPLDMRSVERQVLAMVAGILALWEFDSAEPGGNTVPKIQTYPNCMDPQRYVRVRLRRRALS